MTSLRGTTTVLLSQTLDNVISAGRETTNKSRYFNDPVLWANEVAGITFWSKQKTISQMVLENRNSAIKAGHGVGKSLWIAVLICWWIDTRYPDAFVVSTAPSNKQIGAIVWREIRTIRSRIEQRYNDKVVNHVLPGYITADNEWKIDGGTLLGFGRKPPDQDVGDMIQGIHAQYVLAVGDEAVGLSKEMIEALGNITSNRYSRRVLIANPTNPYCYFAEIFLNQDLIDKQIWTTESISVLESPNYTDEKHDMPPEALAALTGLEYESDMRLQHGEESAMYRSRVMGEFDRDSDEPYLLREEDIAKAEDTDIEVSEDEMDILGVDIARFGKDFSVIYSNRGGQIRYVDHIEHKARSTEVANWIHNHAKNRNASEVRIDGAGIGGPTGDILLSFPDRKYRLVFLNPNATPPDPLRNYNMRSYWWNNFKDGLQSEQIDLDITDPQYNTLKAELLEVRYKFNPQTGAMLIESKDDMTKRGVKSPDFGDAAVFAGMRDYEYANQKQQKKEIKFQDPSELLELGSIDGDFYLELM